MSQIDFAAKIGISSQQTYANYEKGRVPKLKILQQISQQTGVDLAWLISENSDLEQTPQIEPAASSVKDDEIPYRTRNFRKLFEDLVAKIDPALVLDQVESLSRMSREGDKDASDLVDEIIPLLRKRIDILKKSKINLTPRP